MKKKYIERLKDPRWQQKRLRIMERDRWTCQCCFSEDKPLNVHHKYYVYNRDPWDYNDKVLITLCEDCHKDWESNRYVIKDFAKDLLENGWSPTELMKMKDLILSFGCGEIGLQFIKEAIDVYDKSLKLLDDNNK